MELEIIQCTPRGFKPLAWLIRLIQGTNYSHYVFKFTSVCGVRLVIDATSKNIAFRNANFFEKNYVTKKTYPIHMDFSLNTVQKWFELYSGTPYAYMSLFGIILDIRGVGKGDKAMTCNELVLRFLNRFFSANIRDIDLQDLKQTELHLENIIKGL
jgi:hypothetical protein